MRKHIVLFLFVLLPTLLWLQVESQDTTNGNLENVDSGSVRSSNGGKRAKTRMKKTRVKSSSVCPNTCKLKKKLGKMEVFMQGIAISLSTNLRESRNQGLTDYALSNVSKDTMAIYLQQIRHNISVEVEVRMDEAIGELKSVLTEGQDVITAKVQEVNEFMQSIPVRSTPADVLPLNSFKSLHDLTSSVSAMNATLKQLRKQNVYLQKKAKHANDLAGVMREQNQILNSQNRELRLHRQSLDSRTRNCLARIQDLEATFTLMNDSYNYDRRTADFSQPQQDTEVRLRDVEEGVGQTSARLARLETWIQEAARSGEIPLSVPTTTTTTTAIPQPETPPNDCLALYQMGFEKSGVYTIHPWQTREAFNVYCEQDYYGGGWTVIQRRRDGSVNFDRNWDEYLSGFGDLQGEFWLGNEKIHQITNQNTYRLHVVLLDWEDQRAYAEYDGFRLSSSRDYYSISFGRYEGTAGDGLRGNVEDGSRNLYLARFGTGDLDNDSCRPCMYEGQAFENCAKLYKSGWWYRACTDSNLNGRYVSRENMTNCEGGDCFGIQWRTWHDESHYSLRASLMMIRASGAEE